MGPTKNFDIKQTIPIWSIQSTKEESKIEHFTSKKFKVMEYANKRVLPLRMVMCLVLLVVYTTMSSTQACSPNGGDCRNCIAKAMRKDCPKCAPIMRCMARCLWANTPKSKCVKQCDCNTGSYPKLSDCKSCLSQCKCMCAVY